jgi:MFS transporter, MHS family, shikimate and dehydroshikimate transport protein
MQAAAPTQAELRKVGLASAGGGLIEWYDYFLYTTAAALVFGELFFSPSFSPLAATLASFATIIPGFIARPFGGALWGHFGDKVGRKPSLVAAMLLMTLGTVLIGLLPSFETIGIWAPILLVVFRILQGLAVGGQWGGGILLAAEYAPSEKRGFYASLPQLGVPVGLFLGNAFFLAMSLSLSREAFFSWGWRIPFLASIIFLSIALYIALRLEDTPVFRRLEENRQQQTDEEEAGSPVFEAIRSQLRNVLLAVGIFIIGSGFFYVCATGMVDYGTRTLGLSRNTMLLGVLVGALAHAPAVIVSAAISDRIGRRKVCLAAAAAAAVWAFPLFWLVNTMNTALIVVGISVGLIIFGVQYGPLAALFAEMFTARLRYSGISLGYQGATVFSGAIAPLVMTSLLALTGTYAAAAVYVIVMAAISFFATLAVKDTYEDEMDEMEIA